MLSFSAILLIFCGLLSAQTGPQTTQKPLSVYINWAAYDEISDNVPLTESLVMKQFDELLRLRKSGVRLDYYVMDAFWYARDGGYRFWRKTAFPAGPDAWLERCRRENVKPGMWFGVNTLWAQLDPVPEWADSLNPKKNAASTFTGGYLKHYMDSLQNWYDRGVRLFKFDFADFNAAPQEVQAKMSREEIKEKNESAFRDALFKFRAKNPDVVLMAYNGFGGDQGNTWMPYRKSVDLRWLDVFDSMYCGDPRAADLPAKSFWRSKDIYSNHMALRYMRDNVPAERIDGSSFMIGTTGTCYKRGKSAWKGMLLLTLARGGLVNTYYGNLELLDEKDAAWFGRLESLFFQMHALGRFYPFGGVPGNGEPHGFAALDANGALYTVVNPSQSVATVQLPRLTPFQVESKKGRVLFRDAGHRVTVDDDRITLGPEQMALVGYGRYAASAYDFGVQEDLIVPDSIRELPATFSSAGSDAVEASFDAPKNVGLRIVMRQLGPDGNPLRTRGGSPPKGTSMGKIFVLSATQEGKTLPVDVEYDKQIWSGLSWAVGEVKSGSFAPGKPITIRCSSTERKEHKLEAKVYAVTYSK